MVETHLDHPGEMTWFAGHTPLPVLGPCPHAACQHRMSATVAWGPDYEHYTLNRCDDPDGCAGKCRGWGAEAPPRDPRRYRWYGWMLVGDGGQR